MRTKQPFKSTVGGVTKPWYDNRLTESLKIKLPIIQGPLGGFLSQRLTAGVSNYGGLGSFGAHGLSPQAIKDVISEIRSLTEKPFAINLWVSMEDYGAWSSDEAAFERSLSHIRSHILSLNGTPPSYNSYKPMRFEDQARVILDENVPVFSFISGIPVREILDECRHRGIVIVGTATTADEGRALEDAGVDVVVASGFEAGGHRGSFLRSAEESFTGTFSLVPQVADAISLPVAAAGGITDARGIAAAFALGAEGVQMGTVFLPLEQSGASELHRRLLLEASSIETALTRGFTGRVARGIRNPMMDAWNAVPSDILPYPLQRQLMRSLSTLAQEAGRHDLLPLWAGQSAHLAKHTDLKVLLDTLTNEISQILGPIQAWTRELP